MQLHIIITERAACVEISLSLDRDSGKKPLNRKRRRELSEFSGMTSYEYFDFIHTLIKNHIGERKEITEWICEGPAKSSSLATSLGAPKTTSWFHSPQAPYAFHPAC